jgi:hypothetical protein
MPRWRPTTRASHRTCVPRCRRHHPNELLEQSGLDEGFDLSIQSRTGNIEFVEEFPRGPVSVVQRREAHLDHDVPARLIVYEDSGPRSIIADGRLVELEKSELSPETIGTLGSGETPAFELWEEEKTDVECTIHRLVETELTGRKPAES